MEENKGEVVVVERERERQKKRETRREKRGDSPTEKWLCVRNAGESSGLITTHEEIGGASLSLSPSNSFSVPTNRFDLHTHSPSTTFYPFCFIRRESTGKRKVSKLKRQSECSARGLCSHVSMLKCIWKAQPRFLWKSEGIVWGRQTQRTENRRTTVA